MATDTHYINYDPEAIWKEMFKTYVEQGGDILYPGDEKEILLRSVQAVIVQGLAKADNGLLMDSLTHTMDQFMDLYGEKRWCYRLEAQAAEAIVDVTFQESVVQKIIPAGTELTADGQQIYVTKADIQQTGYVQTARIPIAAKEAGAAGNGLAAGTQMQFCQNNAAVTSIIVTTSASGGRNREDDEHYRERIREFGLVSITTGPRQQYERVARSASPYVLDARAVRVDQCEVCVYLILDKDGDAEDAKKAVLDALNDDTQRPMTDLLTVAEAVPIPYQLNVVCTIEAGVATGAFDSVISEYQAWQDDEIQRPFNPEKLMAMLYQAGVSRVQWDTGSHFNGGDVAYTAIGDNECCQGTINLSIQS